METTKDNVLKISKELIGAVLGYEPFKIDKIKQVDGIGKTLVLLNQDGTVRSYQNIYEFAFKCKEWASTKGYKIQSQINYENKGHSHISKISENEWAKGFLKDTEIEAIIQACEWILTQKDKQC